MEKRANAHFYPTFINLMRDMKWFPLWSSVCHKKFGYGKIPAASRS